MCRTGLPHASSLPSSRVVSCGARLTAASSRARRMPAAAPAAPSVAGERREARRFLLLLVPALLVLGAFFVYPLFGILVRSVYKNGYTLDSYRQVFRTSVYLTVIGLTFRTAALVTLACLLLCYPLAYVLSTFTPLLPRVCAVIVV